MEPFEALGVKPMEPPEQQQKPLLFNYEIKCLNGWSYKVASPADLILFRKVAKADGCIMSDKVIIEMAAVATIEFIGMFDPNGGNVVAAPFGQSTKQAIHVVPDQR